jgi:acetyl-CoA acetyltransferase
MQYETPWGMPTPVGGYALAAMRHMHEFGTTSEHLAEIAVATRKWAALESGCDECAGRCRSRTC